MKLNTALAGKVVLEPATEYLAEIGRVLVRWNLLESYLDFTLIKLLGKDITEGRSLALFAHMAVPQKFDLLAAFVNELVEYDRIKHAGLNTAYKRVAPLLREAQKQRNSITHAKWGVNEQGTVDANTVSARGRLRMERRVITIPEIITASNAIYAAAEALYEMAWNPERK